jgi:hypothetical protein
VLALPCDAVHPRLRLAALAVAAIVLAGCGGSDFKGSADVPSDYATYRGDGVTIAYPKGWQVATRKDSDGGSSVRITPKKTTPTPFGVILLSASPDAEKRFANNVKGRRAVLKTVADAKIDSDEKIDVPGAKEAHRLTATAPSRAGTDPVEVKSDSLDLLRDNGDTLTVVVAAPQRKGDDDLDPKVVVDSVRLSD